MAWPLIGAFFVITWGLATVVLETLIRRRRPQPLGDRLTRHLRIDMQAEAWLREQQ